MNIHPLYSLNISVVLSQREAYILKGEGVGWGCRQVYNKISNSSVGGGGGGLLLCILPNIL